MNDTAVTYARFEAGRDAWIWRPKPNPRANLRLFCFPCAGRGASLFREWPARVPAAVDVCAVQYPGREQRLREEPCTKMSNLVAAAAEALQGFLDMPYAVFGHSLGALAGFECARTWRRQGYPRPVHLMLAARRAPHMLERRAPITRLPQSEFIAAVQARYDGIPPEVLRHPDLLDILVPTLRADMMLLETYAHTAERPLNCPITCFGGREDAEATLRDLEGWREHTTGSFAVRVFAGGHFFVQKAHADVMETVRHILSDAVGGKASAGRPTG